MDSMRWPEANFPLSLKVSANLDPQSRNLILDAMDGWERAANLDFFAPLQTTPNLNFPDLIDYYRKDKAVQGIYLATNKITELDDTILAVAQLIFFTNRDNPTQPFYQIVHTDIVLNGYYFKFSTDRLDETTYYLMTLVMHEVGHVLGLGHTNQGIMYPSLSTTDKQDTLTAFDVDLINAKYNTIPTSANENALNMNSSVPSDYQRVLLYLPRGTNSVGR